MKNIFVVIDGNRRGPLASSELRGLLEAGQIQSDTPALCEGDEEWSTVASFLKLPDAVVSIPETGGAGVQPLASVSRDFKNIKRNSSATVDELRAFMREMRGKTPREMLGSVAQSSLILSALVSSGIILVLLVILTVAPYTYGVVKKKAEAKTAEAVKKLESISNTLESDNNSKSTIPNSSEKPPTVPAVNPPEVLGVGGERTGKPKEVNPFENKDDLLGDPLDK
tara:strand:- start:284 stop:958 length:675 start_codon:yes stop_codon:yes gene_type:complete